MPFFRDYALDCARQRRQRIVSICNKLTAEPWNCTAYSGLFPHILELGHPVGRTA